MQREIRTSIVIAAPAAKVWAALMDFEAYPEWNPFIRKISGRAHVGERLEVLIEPPGRKAQTFKPIVVACENERSFRWQGSLPLPGLFNGLHAFDLTAAAGDGTRFDHSEFFSGLLLPLLGGVLRDSEIGFQRMNEALGRRAAR